MLAHMLFAIEDIPQFRALVFGIPLSEFIAMRKEPFFGTGFLFIAAAASDGYIEFVFFDGIQQGNGLQYVPTGIESRFFGGASLIDAGLYRSHNEAGAQLFNECIAVGKRLLKIVSRINVRQCKWDFLRPESFPCQMDHHDGVLAAGKE
jgi:hypothetical protein